MMATIQDRFRAALRGWQDPHPNGVVKAKIPAVEPASNQAIPADWTSAPFAPGQPIEPWTQVPSYRDDKDKAEPRIMDYVPSVNVTISPRIPYGLMSFGRLRYLAEQVPEAAMLIRLTTEEMKTLKPVLKDKSGEVIEPGSEPDLLWMTTKPDGRMAFPLWLSRLLYNIQVYDAPALWYKRDENNLIRGLKVIDGSTIFVVVDSTGDQPAAPAPAFTQIIQGTPFMWMTSEQLWYRPRQARADAPYGRTPAEDIQRVMEYLDNLWNYEAAKYTEGNMAEMLLTAPEGWSPKQTLEYEGQYNSRMSGNNAERRRIRFLPPGFAKIETKQVPFDIDAYMVAFERVSYAYGFPLSEIGKAPGGGLGGKGFQDKGESQHYRQGIGPLKESIEAPFNDVLSMMGREDLKFELVFDSEEIDAERRSNQVLEDWINGIATLNETRQTRGYKVLDGPIGDARLTPTGKDLKTADQQNDAIVNPPPPPQQILPQPPEPDQGEADEKQPPDENAEKPKNEDEKAVEKAVAAAEDHSNDAMIAFFLPDAPSRAIASLLSGQLPEGSIAVPPEEYHVTLAYLGEVDQLPYTFQEVADVVKHFAECWSAPVLGRVNGIGMFTETHIPGMVCVYANFDAPDLGTFQHHLVEDTLREGYGYDVAKNHGFTPHVSLAYVPVGAPVPEVDLTAVDVSLTAVSVAWGTDRLDLSIIDGTFSNYEKAMLANFIKLDLRKHCGLCEEDDGYYGAKVSKEMTIPFGVQGANETQVVALTPKKMDPRPALWKPLSGENAELQRWLGGEQYVREEAAYLADRTMELYLVPVSYATKVNGEDGSVTHFVRSTMPKLEADQYAPEWVEKAAVLDWVTGQMDRGTHNWLTHPDDARRPVLPDNGLSFSTKAENDVNSAFVRAMMGKPLSDAALASVQYLMNKKAYWVDLRKLVGADAAALCKDRCATLLSYKMIPMLEPPSA